MRSTSGITCCHFFCSAVFSIPVCRYPMVGDAESTCSPSSSSTRRSTPCVLGCCGPIFTVMISLRISGIVVGRPKGLRYTWSLLIARQAVALDVLTEFFRRHLQGFGRVGRTTDLHGRVFPQRKAFPVFRHQQPTRIGMAIEDDPEQ